MKWDWKPPGRYPDPEGNFEIPHMFWRVRRGLYVMVLDWRGEPATARGHTGYEGILVSTGNRAQMRATDWKTVRFGHPEPLAVQCWLIEHNLLPKE